MTHSGIRLLQPNIFPIQSSRRFFKSIRMVNFPWSFFHNFQFSFKTDRRISESIGWNDSIRASDYIRRPANNERREPQKAVEQVEKKRNEYFACSPSRPFYQTYSYFPLIGSAFSSISMPIIQTRSCFAIRMRLWGSPKKREQFCRGWAIVHAHVLIPIAFAPPSHILARS